MASIPTTVPGETPLQAMASMLESLCPGTTFAKNEPVFFATSCGAQVTLLEDGGYTVVLEPAADNALAFLQGFAQQTGCYPLDDLQTIMRTVSHDNPQTSKNGRSTWTFFVSDGLNLTCRPA